MNPHVIRACDAAGTESSQLASMREDMKAESRDMERRAAENSKAQMEQIAALTKMVEEVTIGKQDGRKRRRLLSPASSK